MRLTEHEQQNIVASIGKFVGQHLATLYLYGSRTDDALKGGDIDLVLVTDRPTEKLLQPQKYAMLVAIKEKLGERRIDLSVISSEQIPNDPFWKNVLPQAVKLGEW